MSHPIDDRAARPERGRAGPLKTAFITLLIILAGIALIWLIFKTEPTATRKDAARETAMLVDVQAVSRGQYTPTVEVMGQVMPARDVTLSTRVGGRVIQQTEQFTPGRHVEKGDELLRIEPADYQAALEQRRSELEQALADLEMEQGQQAVARQEFELLGEEIPMENEGLILRKPQLRQAQASVSSGGQRCARRSWIWGGLEFVRRSRHRFFPGTSAWGLKSVAGRPWAGWWARNSTG